MGNGSKMAVIITVLAFAAIIFFSILYYKFSEHFVEFWDYFLSPEFSTEAETLFYTYEIQIILAAVFVIIMLILLYSFKRW